MSGTTQKTQFSTGSGEKLSAALELPSGEPRAFALMAHCFSCSKDIKAAREIAKALRLEGFAVLRFDFTGLGASEGEFANTNFSSNVDDLVAAADFLRDEFGAPQILIGHSLGGAASIVAAARIPEVKGVVVIGAPAEASHVFAHIGDTREKIEQEGKAVVQLAGRPFTIKKQFLEDLAGQNVIDAAHNLDRPFLVLHAPLDNTVGLENASRLFAAAKHPKSFVSLDDADHLLSKTADARYAANVIAAWSLRYIDANHSVKENHSTAKQSVTSDPVAPKGGAAASLIPGYNFATRVSMDGHPFTIDAGVGDGGNDLGPNPTRVLEAALAACGTITMKMYANRKKWPLEGATVSIEKSVGEDSHSAKILEKEIHFQGDLDDEQKAKLIEIADKCPVHRMLTQEIIIRKKNG